MIRTSAFLTAAVLALLSTPGLAQDADPNNQLIEGYLTCLTANGDLDVAEEMLVNNLRWLRSDEGEEGLTYFFPAEGEQTFVYMADDGSFCHVESTTIESATASEILSVSLASLPGTTFDYSKTDDGCTRLDFDTGVTATIQSGGNDPTCGSETDSAVRFDFSGT